MKATAQLLILLFISALLLFSPTPLEGQADNERKTFFSINEPVQIPGQVLPPGDYVIRGIRTGGLSHRVQFLNANQTRVIATVTAKLRYRRTPSEKPILTYFRTASGHLALGGWFYEGDIAGLEFLYPTSPESATRAEQPPAEAAGQPAGEIEREYRGEEKADSAPEPWTANSYGLYLGILVLGVIVGLVLLLRYTIRN